MQVDLHGLHVEEALRVLERHLIALGGLGHPGGTLLQVPRAVPGLSLARHACCCLGRSALHRTAITATHGTH